MPLPVIFGPETAPTLAQLDTNFATVAALGALPCSIAGTNILSLTMATTNPTLSGYANYLLFSGAASGGNTGPVTAAVGGFAAVPVYKNSPTGPVPLVAGDIAAGNGITLMYDAALNGGAGGFHLGEAADSAYGYATQSTVTSVTGTVIPASAIAGGIILRAGAATAAFTDTLDTAVNILTALPGISTGQTFGFRILNQTSQLFTLSAGAGVTLSASPTVAPGASRLYQGLVTSGTTVTIFGTGQAVPAYQSGALATVTNNAGVTLSAQFLTGTSTGNGFISRLGSPGAGFSDTTDTAAAIIGWLPTASAGTLFSFTIANGTAQTQTLVAGAGITFLTVPTIPAGTSHRFSGLLTSSSAITIIG